MPKKTFTPLLLWNWLSWHYKLIARSASRLQPIHLLQQYFFTASLCPKQRPLCCRNMLLLTAPAYFHQICSTPTKLGRYTRGTVLPLGQLTSFIKASDKQRMICILKRQFQNRKAETILIPHSFCSSEFTVVSQSTATESASSLHTAGTGMENKLLVKSSAVSKQVPLPHDNVR